MEIKEPKIVLGDYAFEPQTDITAYELALVFKFTTVAMTCGNYTTKFSDYMVLHNLARHFVKE